MRRLSRGVLFCPLHRGKSGTVGQGVANAVSQSPECLSCHMTLKGKSRNVLASPLGEEGHEVAKGWTVVILIMILDVDVTAERRHYNLRPLKGKRLTTFCASLRSGGRRLAVRKMIECHISAQPRTPFCHYVAFPLKGKREIWREKQASHILHVPFRCVPPWWLAPPPCPVGSMSLDSQSPTAPYESSSFATPASGGTITRAYCRAAYGEIASRCFIVPPLSGGKVVP